MKQKRSSFTNSPQNNKKKHLWRQIAVKQSNTACKDKKKQTTITEFLKTVHHESKSFYDESESDVISVAYIQNPKWKSKRNYSTEKKYFFGLLINAVKSIWSQINCLTQILKNQMKKDFEKTRMMFDKLVYDYKCQIQKLKGKIEQVKQQNSALKTENQSLKQKVQEKQLLDSESLIETNKELRGYLKNMNEIMMSYHHKNQQLEESMRDLQAKMHTAMKESSSAASFRSKYGINLLSNNSLQGTSITHNLPVLSSRTSKEGRQKHDQSILDQQLVDTVYVNQISSPKSSSSKRFFRTNHNSPCFQNKYTSKYNYGGELAQSIECWGDQSIRKGLCKIKSEKSIKITNKKKLDDPPVLQTSMSEFKQ